MSTGQTEGILLEGQVDDVMVSGAFPFGFEDQIEVAPLDPFNYLFIDEKGSRIDFVMDNIRVKSGLIPEPSNIILAILEAAGVAACRVRTVRRRRD